MLTRRSVRRHAATALHWGHRLASAYEFDGQDRVKVERRYAIDAVGIRHKRDVGSSTLPRPICPDVIVGYLSCSFAVGNGSAGWGPIFSTV